MRDETEIEAVGEAVSRLALRTPTLPPATHTNSYFVGLRAFYVVEPASPWPEEQQRLHDAVARRIAAGDTLLGAVVTHHHGDHVGGAAEFCARFAVPLFAHPLTRDRLADRVAVDRTLDDGAVLPGLDVRALHTPGHAPGHLCFAHPSGWIIVGDMVASEGTILIDTSDGGDMHAYLTQLERLASLAPARLLPAHGAPIDDAVARLRFYIAHRLAREARVLDAVTDEPCALDAIAARAYADSPHAPVFLTERSAHAHLVRLASHGHITRHGDGRWSRNGRA